MAYSFYSIPSQGPKPPVASRGFLFSLGGGPGARLDSRQGRVVYKVDPQARLLDGCAYRMLSLTASSLDWLAPGLIHPGGSDSDEEETT